MINELISLFSKKEQMSEINNILILSQSYNDDEP